MRRSVSTKMHGERVKKSSKLTRFIWVLIIVGVLGVLFLLGKFLYGNFAPQSNLAEHLPAEETVAYIEMDGFDLPKKLSEKVDQAKFASVLNQLMDFEIKPAVEAFGTGKVAYVFLDVDGEEDKPVIFIQSKSKGNALSYFKTLRLEGEELSDDDNAIYTFTQGQPYSFKFLDRYVAITPDEKLFETLNVESGKALSEDPDYAKTINNLPRNKWLSGYINVQKLAVLPDSVLKNVLEPLKHTIHNFAFTVRQNDEGFLFNTFLNFDKKLISMSSEDQQEKFSHELADYLPAENMALYLGGLNLAEEWQSTLESISNLNPSYGLIMEGLLRAQTDKLFGQDVDLRNDLYPLFEGEYALMLGKSDDANELALVLAHDDKAFVEKKMEKMARGFEFIASTFEPKVSVVALPDGTESRELVPDDASIEKTEDKIDGYDVHCTEVGTKTAFCYTITDEIVIMANDKDLLENALKTGQGIMVSSDPSFEKTTNQLSNISDEISFLSFDRFNALFEANPYLQLLKPVTQHFDSMAWVNQYFDDGMTSEGYILVK